MKKQHKWLAGILVGAMSLSAVAYQQSANKTPVFESTAVSAVTSQGEMAETYSTITTLTEGTDDSTNRAASLFQGTEAYFQTLASTAAYDKFYSQYGYDKVAHVFYNGQALPFTDAFPMIENGATFLPLAVFAEQIGATTQYIADTHSVSLEYKGDTITFDIGKAQFYVNGGAAQELPYATFTASDRTMVPLRFITDAFGLSLYWNDSMRHVIAADLNALTEGKSYDMIHSLFAFLNSDVSGSNVKLSGNFEYTLGYNGKIMSLNSDLNAHANDDMSGISYELDFAMDITPFESELRTLLAQFSPDADVNSSLVDQLLASSENFDFNYKYDFENMVFYLQSSLIADLLPVVSTSSNDLGITQKTWFRLSLADSMTSTEVASMQAMMSQVSGSSVVSTVDDLVASIMEMTRYHDNYAVNSYGSLETLLSGVHDGAFGQNDGGYQAKGSFSNGVEMVYYDLTLYLDDNSAVESYTLLLTFQENANEVVRFTVTQEEPTKADIVVDGLFSGVSISMRGNLDVDYTNEKAPVAPVTGDIMDLSTFF